jgi:hypothetical protein
MLTLAALLCLPAVADDEADIRAAVQDYVLGVYEVKPERIDRSVAADLKKVGYWRDDASKPYAEFHMNFAELRDLASTWNKAGKVDAKAAKQEIRILDRLDVTAVARLDAEWGIDYFHLAKLDGKWKIVNVLWQSYPTQEAAKTR